MSKKQRLASTPPKEAKYVIVARKMAGTINGAGLFAVKRGSNEVKPLITIPFLPNPAPNQAHFFAGHIHHSATCLAVGLSLGISAAVDLALESFKAVAVDVVTGTLEHLKRAPLGPNGNPLVKFTREGLILETKKEDENGQAENPALPSPSKLILPGSRD